MIEGNQSIGERFANIDSSSIGRHAPIVGLIGMYALFGIYTENFLTVSNQINVLNQSAIIGVLAIGMSFAIFCGEIDLSVAEIMQFVGLLIAALATGMLMWPQLPPLVAIIIGLLVGVGLGGVSGYITSRFDVPSFMTTLAMLFLASGFGLITTNSRPVLSLPGELVFFGGESILSVPVLVIVFIACIVLGQLILSYTRFGQHVYAVGGNREAAARMGVNVMRIRMGVIMISGGFAALAGLLMLGRIGSATPTMGVGYLLPPIAAVVLGGADLFGGEGHMYGTLIGVLILAVLSNGLNLMGVSTEAQLVAQGIILMLAVIANVMFR
ncbi:ABC transporter permease [Natrarchaeobius chitinivorans]|uniref:ABC transporter permease n=1 Tax=Natrarchaeobius chitinivorans TaxID=1679083 RepID=A0A3N6LZZ6_NATCH|nr:ABC transporter permease [Natrarchaeobius chitinivorans]RQG96523.1 ABC transporter permease [Natrarchaeobius chitinivorans]